MSIFHKSVAHVRNFYARFERPISSFSLVAGFVFDAVTLKRVDLFWDNVWVAGHLIIVAACIILINREENRVGQELVDPTDPAKLHFWMINILQFFFGGLLSTYLVFYFRSAVLMVAWPFLLILLVAFIANESLKRHFARLFFQIGFLFLSIFLFAIFIVPVIIHQIGPWIFVLSGAISLVMIGLFLFVLKLVSREVFGRNKLLLGVSILGVFVAVNALYFLHLIPPLPLSLQDAGVYHSIVRTTDGNYTVTYEDGGFWGKFMTYFGQYQTYHIIAGDPAYVYSAIFAPTSLTTTIIHDWQYYDQSTKRWISVDDVNLKVVGGRDAGYRTYSLESSLTPGRWRVNVKTPSDQLIGRLVFYVMESDTVPVLQTQIK
jgi:hypothetical protein